VAEREHSLGKADGLSEPRTPRYQILAHLAGSVASAPAKHGQEGQENTQKTPSRMIWGVEPPLLSWGVEGKGGASGGTVRHLPGGKCLCDGSLGREM